MRNALLLSSLIVLGFSLHQLLFTVWSPADERHLAQELELSDASIADLGSTLDPKSLLRLSRKLDQLATEADSGEEQVQLLCRSLSLLGELVRREPLSSFSLMEWAALRAVLGKIECGLPMTHGEVTEVIQFAIANDPVRPERYLAAAQLSRYMNKSQAVVHYLHQYLLRLAPRIPSRAELDFVLSEINTPELLLEVVPAVLDTVVEWSVVLTDLARSDSDWEEALATLQAKALESHSLSPTLEGSGMDVISARSRSALYRLSLRAVRDDLRRAADLVLSRELSRAELNDQAEYFGQRAKLNRLALAATYHPGDLAPQRSPLALWASERPLIFDKYYTSIGFFLPDGSSPKLIQLTALRGGDLALLTPFLRMFVSEDNERFTDVSAQFRFTLKTAPIGSLIEIRPVREISGRYWKIHFANGKREGTFGAKEMDLFLAAFDGGSD